MQPWLALLQALGIFSCGAVMGGMVVFVALFLHGQRREGK